MAALTLVPPRDRSRLPALLLVVLRMVGGSFLLLLLVAGVQQVVQGGAEGRAAASSASIAAGAARLNTGLRPHRLVVDPSLEAKRREFSPSSTERQFLRKHHGSSSRHNRRRLDDSLDAPLSGASDGTVSGTVRDALLILGSIVLMVGIVLTATYVQVRYCKYYGWGASARQTMAAAAEARARRQLEMSPSDPVLSRMTAEERLHALRHILPASKHPDAPNDDDDQYDDKHEDGESPTSNDFEDALSSSCFFYGQLRDGNLDATRVDGHDASNVLYSGDKHSPSSPVPSSHPEDDRGGDNNTNNTGGRHFQAGCSICLSTYHKRTLLLQTSCGHIFHYDCCLEWLASRSGGGGAGNNGSSQHPPGDYGCPYCRTTLVTPEQLRTAAEQLLGPDRIEQLLLAAGQPRKEATADDDHDDNEAIDVGANGSTSSISVSAASDTPDAGGDDDSGGSQDR